ncbi:hypothetical protein BD289DRAFT_365470 [Coniella lustricola]|uniref:LPXTG-domain-containing protein n=1 Tax=Coniella lustricola TaxID=2025994 RepID=A0A2T3AC94_9PEZI|nr:hypothetical protein BD289DRAFT_365470 [Coniella lustricola]
MVLSILRLIASVASFKFATAILVTTGSTCDQQCGNILTATTPADIVCQNSDFSGSTGTVMKNCMNCELTSTYYTTNPNSTDQQWLLYNSRYTLSECLWGEPGNIDVGDTPCVTSEACGPLQNAFQYMNFSTSSNVGAYDYCNEWNVDDENFDGCLNCLRTGGQQYLGNMAVMLKVGCDQKPTPGSTIAVNGGIFSTVLMNETTPTATSTWQVVGVSGPVSLGGIVGIAIGGLCFLLAVAGFFVVCFGRRRRRAFLRKLEMQHKDSGWPHPFATGIMARGPDMNETPLSQKPLRGWDDSPQSATNSEPYYTRYFSPYSSQHTSPANGAEVTMAMAQQWPQAFHEQLSYGAEYPTAAQEKAMQNQHEATTSSNAGGGGDHLRPPVHIGMAFGGDEPSLRSKVSDQSVQSIQSRGTGGAQSNELDNVESYELHEVSSSAGGSSAGGMNTVAGNGNSFKNRVARQQNAAPVLRHPGYGRYSPERMFPPPPPLVHPTANGLRDEPEGQHEI